MDRLHADWVTKLLFIAELNCLVCSSADGNVSFIDARAGSVLRVFRGHSLKSSHGIGTLAKEGKDRDASSVRDAGSIVSGSVLKRDSVYSIGGLSSGPQSFRGIGRSASVHENSTVLPSIPGLSGVQGQGSSVTRGVEVQDGSVRTRIQAFSWSGVGKYIASGGERELLLWDPFTLEVMTALQGLSGALASVEVSDEFSRIFACTADKALLIWHSQTFEPLQSVHDETVYRPLDALTSLLVIPELKLVYTCGNRLTMWGVERYVCTYGGICVGARIECGVMYEQ
jgi:WD40 repeat protein